MFCRHTKASKTTFAGHNTCRPWKCTVVSPVYNNVGGLDDRFADQQREDYNGSSPQDHLLVHICGKAVCTNWTSCETTLADILGILRDMAHFTAKREQCTEQ